MARAGMVGVLTAGIGDGADKVRRRMAATLGELLFYVAMQPPARPSRACLPSSSQARFLRVGVCPHADAAPAPCHGFQCAWCIACLGSA